uniref:Uncharacterized protein n=1 Tax=Cacopsylla melanoneura TaxID=428564 RepID=A0A8D8Y361_9HEMI
MELQLFELVTSDICKLVYGFLLELDMFPLAVQFLNSSSYLSEFAKVRKQNKMFICSVNGHTLEQWLEKAALVYSIEQYVEQKRIEFKLERKLFKSKNLLQKFDILLKHAQQLNKPSERSTQHKAQVFERPTPHKSQVFERQTPQKAQVFERATPHEVQVFDSREPQERVDTRTINEECHINDITNVDQEDTNVLKKLTKKDKKILVDVMEKADTVSELLAQKISEELNRKCTSHGSMSNINDLAHQVMENTASDQIFDELCAEMYEGGFLADLVQSEKVRQRISARKLGSPQKSISTPSTSKQLDTSLHTPEDLPPSQPPDGEPPSPQQHSPSELTMKSSPASQCTTEPQDSHMLDPGDPNTPMSLSTLDPNGCSMLEPQKVPHSPPMSPVPPSNSTMVEVNVEGSPKTYHVMRPMSVSSDVSSVMSSSSLDTSVSAYAAPPHSYGQGSTVSAISVCTTGTSSQGSVTSLSNKTLYLSPGKGQFILPTSTGLLTPVSNGFGQPVLGTQLFLLPITSPGPTVLHSPTLTPLSDTIQTPHQVMNPALTPVTGAQFQRYVKIKPKPCGKSKDPNKSGNHPIIVQVANQINTPIPMETNQNNGHHSEHNSINTTHQTNTFSNCNHANIPNETKNTFATSKCIPSEIDTKALAFSGSKSVECSPYKLDTFVSFKNSTSSIIQSENQKNQFSEFRGSSSDETLSKTNRTTGPTVDNNSETLETPCKVNVDSELNCNQPRETETTLESRNKTNADENESNNDEERGSTPAGSSVNTEQGTKHDGVMDQINQTEVKMPSIEQDVEQNTINKTKTNHVDPNDHDVSNETIHVSEANKTNASNEDQTECVAKDQRSEQAKDLSSKSLLDDSVKFIINEEPLDSVSVYESCSENNLVAEAAVIVIPPPDEIVSDGIENEQTAPSQVESPSEATASNQVVALEDKESQGRKSDFYLVTEPKHVYVVVNNHPPPINEAKEKASAKTALVKGKPSTSKKPNKVLEKSSPEKAKPTVKSNKQSPRLLKEMLSKVSESKEPSGTKVHNLSLDFLNCKVTPAVKVLSTPKRKSSSTPRRSHVRALKFETPLKPSVTKRKCNTSPKECKNQTPIIFERVEKPKNVSRNLCEDVEMKKHVEPVKQKQPWDVGLRNLIVTPKVPKPLHKIGKERKKSEKKTKIQVRSHQSKKKKGSLMKTIPEELNNSDNAKCSLDKENKQDSVAPVECDPVSNEGEGSILSLNVDDTPLKIADFQDDIHDNLKTPSKGLLFPSRNLTFTPIDNIIRNNIGESESLLKIIEDINMFKETPIKEALENLSDKSNTPSPCKTSLVNPETKIQDNSKLKEISPDITKSGKKKNTKKRKDSNKSAPKKCKINGKKKPNDPGDPSKPIESCDSSFETEITISQRTNRKQARKPVEMQQPLRRSLRTNSAINKENSRDPNDKDSMISISDDEHAFMERRKKKSSKEKSEEVPQETNTSIKEDIDKPTSSQYNGFNQNTSRLSDNSSVGENNCQLSNQSPALNLQNYFKSSNHETSTSETYRLRNEDLRISTFLDDCVSENQKALQNAKESSKKRVKNNKLYENDAVTCRKRKGTSDENVEKSKTSKRRKKSPRKLKINSKSTKHSSNKEISISTVEMNTLTILSTLASTRSKLDVCDMDETSLDNIMKTNQIPLNLSATSSDKENSSTIDVEVTTSCIDDKIDNDTVTPIVENTNVNDTVTFIVENTNPSENIIVNSVNNSKEISSDCNNTVNTSLENNQNINVNNKPCTEIVIDKVDDTLSDDEESKVFIYISHQDTKHVGDARSHTNQSDKARNFEVELVVGEDTKKLVSSELYNILDFKP